MRVRRLLFLVLAMLVFTAVGCGDARYHLTVNRDGSGDIELRVSLDNMTLELLGQVNANPMTTLKEVLEEDGYTVSPDPGSSQRGIIGRKHVDELTPKGLGVAAIPRGQALSPAVPESIQVSRGFFKISYHFETEIDPMSFVLRVRELKALENYLLAKMQYELALTLPIPADEHNANTTYDEGRTLIWHLVPGQGNRVLVVASHWNPVGPVLTIMLLILVGAGAYWQLRKRDDEV